MRRRKDSETCPHCHAEPGQGCNLGKLWWPSNLNHFVAEGNILNRLDDLADRPVHQWSDSNEYPHSHLECAGCNDLAAGWRADQKELEELRQSVRDALAKFIHLQESLDAAIVRENQQLNLNARLHAERGALAVKLAALKADKGGGDPKGIAQPASGSGGPTPSSSASSGASTNGTLAKDADELPLSAFYCQDPTCYCGFLHPETCDCSADGFNDGSCVFHPIKLRPQPKPKCWECGGRGAIAVSRIADDPCEDCHGTGEEGAPKPEDPPCDYCGSRSCSFCVSL
jgi:hypothetical protein